MTDFLDIFLEDNKDYRAFINAVFKHAMTIEYVVLDYLDGHPDILSYLDDNNIAPKKVKNWQGTHTRSKNNDLYRFPATTGFKKILLGFDNFYIIERKEISDNKYLCNLEMTSWGQSDIAFFDKNDEVIAFIIAHEGWLSVNEKYKYDFKEFLPDPRASYIFGLL